MIRANELGLMIPVSIVLLHLPLFRCYVQNYMLHALAAAGTTTFKAATIAQSETAANHELET